MNNQCCFIGLIPLNKVESALICQCHIKLEVILLDPNINRFSIHVMNLLGNTSRDVKPRLHTHCYYSNKMHSHGQNGQHLDMLLICLPWGNAADALTAVPGVCRLLAVTPSTPLMIASPRGNKDDDDFFLLFPTFPDFSLKPKPSTVLLNPRHQTLDPTSRKKSEK